MVKIMRFGLESRIPRRLWLFLACALSGFCLLLAGCAAPKYNVTVGYHPSMALPNGVYPSVEVDVVAVTTHEYLRLDAYPTDFYFQPGDKFRKSLVSRVMRFSDDAPSPREVGRGDEIWKDWNGAGATRLYLIANLPGIWEVKFGKLDGRRLSLPLASSSWPDGRNIEVEITPAGLKLKTRMTPEAQATQ